VWCDCGQPWKVVDKGERYGEEGIDDRKVVLTGWVVNARTIPVIIEGVVVALLP
jgi:hypothetical protein